jgi:trans-aconitate methyltransferase
VYLAIMIGQSDSSERKIFISWAGEEAWKIADWLKLNILDVLPGFENVYLSTLVETGANWRETLTENLASATDCIGIITDVSLTRPWFLFELGYLASRQLKIKLLRFCPELPPDHPLHAYQMGDGTEISTIHKVVSELLADANARTQSLAREAVAARAARWAEFTRPIKEEQRQTSGLRQAMSTLNGIFTDHASYEGLSSNSCMRELARKALNDLSQTLRKSVESGQKRFTVDHRRYPEFLTHLQRTLPCRTVAIALIEEVEEFWAGNTASEILKTTSTDSRRVFVFANPDVFDKYCDSILLHAERYTVYVMSTEDFSRYGKAKGDFSVVTDVHTGDQVTAFYDNAAAHIEFSMDQRKIKSNMIQFDEVLVWAHLVKPPRDSKLRGEFKRKMRESVFTPSPNMERHHSDAIPIELYDIYEEDHPYYREMHERMLAEFRRRAGTADASFQVLEIGAGTGHFTKKLAQQPFANVRIKAMEPDPKAQPLLEAKVKHMQSVSCIRASALHYDPRGEFRFVFSSFSEHHIKPDHKQLYFEVLTGTMERGGYFIVGDEFLPAHNHEDADDYKRALEKYHNFIIDEALRRHLVEAARLESYAKNSGMPDANPRVDFKITLDRYKQFAKDGGLQLESEFCISPMDVAQEVGGMYVLVFRKPE